MHLTRSHWSDRAYIGFPFACSLDPVIHKLQHHGQRKPARRFGGLAAAGKQRRELAILTHGAKRGGDTQAERAFGESGTGNMAGLFKHRERVLQA